MEESRCEVYAGSAVDEWAGTDIQNDDDRCEATASWNVTEEGLTPQLVCDVHQKAWVLTETDVKSERIGGASDEEVAAAIASILGGVRG
jgi:hypothetical protein